MNTPKSILGWTWRTKRQPAPLTNDGEHKTEEKPVVYGGGFQVTTAPVAALYLMDSAPRDAWLQLAMLSGDIDLPTHKPYDEAIRTDRLPVFAGDTLRPLVTIEAGALNQIVGEWVDWMLWDYCNEEVFYDPSDPRFRKMMLEAARRTKDQRAKAVLETAASYYGSGGLPNAAEVALRVSMLGVGLGGSLHEARYRNLNEDLQTRLTGLIPDFNRYVEEVNKANA